MADRAFSQPLRELPGHFSLPLIGETLAFVRDPAGFLQKRARALGPVFRIDVFGAPTACFVGPEAFALVLDDNNVARAGANPPHVEELFDPQAVPFLDGEKQRRRKRLLMRAFAPDALEEYLPTIEQVIDRYAARWGGMGRFAWVPELTAMGFAIAASLFIGLSTITSAVPARTCSPGCSRRATGRTGSAATRSASRPSTSSARTPRSSAAFRCSRKISGALRSPLPRA